MYHVFSINSSAEYNLFPWEFFGDLFFPKNRSPKPAERGTRNFNYSDIAAFVVSNGFDEFDKSTFCSTGPNQVKNPP
jgi:hypothetical protein